MRPPFLSGPGLDSGNFVLQRQDIGHWPDGRNGEGVDLGVAAGVVVLDVEEVGGVAEGGVVPVQVTHPLVDGRVAGADVADVALEVLDVDGVEADDGGEEADVGLGRVRGGEEEGCRGGGEGGFHAVERGEESVHIFGVGFLGPVWRGRGLVCRGE